MSYYEQIEKIYPGFKLPNDVLDADSMMFANVFDEPIGSKILEVGCSEEPLAYALSEIGFNVAGIDLRFATVRNNLVNYTFIKGNFIEVDFVTKFDSIILISTIEHVGLGIYGEPKIFDGDILAMNRVYNALNDGGHVYITIPFGVAGEWKGWRVYDRDAIYRRLVGSFKILHSRVFASEKYREYNIGDLVPESEAVNSAGPNLTMLMVLEKEARHDVE